MGFTSTQHNVEEPVTSECERPGRGFETKTTHPAFAQISASRVNGRANLYGSDFSHNAYIAIEVNGSELYRNLSSDWHFARQVKFRLAMSEAQWATFVSSLNNGSGVPATMEWEQGKGPIPRLPDPQSRSEMFSSEMETDFEEALASLDELKETVTSSVTGLSKKKQEAILDKISIARSKLTSSAAFVADQFGEHMEKEVERAKVEIHGYANNLFTRAGVAALAGEGPLALEDKSDD